jgi:dihydroflavonol-4-reductase
MNVITGATGLIGMRLTLDLIKEGKPVRALKRKTSSLDLMQKVFAFYEPEHWSMYWDKISWVEADLMDIHSLEAAFYGAQVIYHCGAIVSFDPRQADYMMQQNTEGTANVVNAALHLNIPRLAYTSSVSALGPAIDGQPHTEEAVWVSGKEQSKYGLSKYLAEMEVWRGAAEGLSVVMVNPSVVIGAGKPGQSSAQVFQRLKKPLPFYPIGTAGFVDVRDVSALLIALAGSSIKAERFILNAANVPYAELMQWAGKAYDYTPPNKPMPTWVLNTVWRLGFIWSILSGNTPTITKETAKRLKSRTAYSSQKLRHTMQWDFIHPSESVAYFAPYYGKLSTAG